MSAKKELGPHLRVIEGGLACCIRFGSLQIVSTPESAPPFEVDAVAFEEDTFLIMSAARQVIEPREHPIRIMTEVINFKPAPVGRVLIRGQKPLRFLAIVHDLNHRPSWKEEWISGALREIFRLVEQRQLHRIALQPLGTIYGQLTIERFGALLSTVLKSTAFDFLRHIWLQVPIGVNQILIRKLESLLCPADK